ncbi:amidohydrolase [Candidatus Bathyarchaeota archaeon]|nr:MAG: amidohydrolase [Candidatus Bathyarchaeota archaeon]
MSGWSAAKRGSTGWIDENAARMAEMSDTLFRWAEPGLREYKSSKLLADYLRENGFQVKEDVSGMPTAFVAEWGDAGPVMGFFAEYDATPGHSQRAVPYEEPAVPHGPGFTDAHNMIGVASCIAAVALKETVLEHGIEVRIRLLGTPAEKLCVGKSYMARDGLFDGIDALLAWHPGGPTTVLGEVWPLAYKSMLFRFRVERAAGGTSGDVSYPGALDAAVLMYNNVNIMKEHMPALMRRGGSINEFMMSGGQATVATPEFSQIVYCWRTRSLPDQEAITRVIERCAQGAALVTKCDEESRLITAVRTGLPNSVLTDTVMENLRAIGPPRHTEEDIEFARKIQENLGLEPMEQPYDETLTEPEHAYDKFHPADDVNEFTWHAPSVRLYVSKSLAPVPGFRYPRWVVAALCGTGATHRMGETAAKTMTATALDLLERPELLARAREEFEKRKEKHYEAPLVPEGLSPPIGLRWPEWVDRPGSEWWIPP